MKSNLISRDMEVLGAVRRLRGTGYGVNLRKEIAKVTGRMMSYATLYDVLERLEKDGLIVGRMAEPTPARAGRPKQLFTVTGVGEKAYSTALATMQSFAPQAIPAGGGKLA